MDEEIIEETQEQEETQEPVEEIDTIRIREVYSRRDMNNRRLEIYYRRLDALLAAEKSLAGGVKSYSIGGRSLTRYDIGDIANQIDSLLNKIEKMEEATITGKSRKKCIGVVIRDV